MARRPNQPRKKSELARDQVLIGRAYLAGKTQPEIAELIGVSQATVSRNLKELHAAWQQEALKNIDEVKARELAKLDVLELEYWDAWKRSQVTAQKRSVKRVGSGNEPVESKIIDETQVGDPRFLAGVMSCIQKRCEILGVDAPKKIEGNLKGELQSWGKFIKGQVEPDNNG